MSSKKLMTPRLDEVSMEQMRELKRFQEARELKLDNLHEQIETTKNDTTLSYQRRKENLQQLTNAIDSVQKEIEALVNKQEILLKTKLN